MRHYNVPRLQANSYYVVFCECGKELKRFRDTGQQTGREKFEVWLQATVEADRWCHSCYQKQDRSAQNLSLTLEWFRAGEGTPMREFINDLSDSLREFFGQVDFSKATLDSKREACKRVSHIAATAAAAVALQPIPVADIFLLTPIQILLVQSIGRIYGVPLSARTALEIATNIGMGVVLQQIFIAITKIGVPLMGGLLCSTYVYTATYYMGRVAQIYFEKGRPLTNEELNNIQTSRSRAEERLREIDALRRAELINDEEFQRKRNEILDSI